MRGGHLIKHWSATQKAVTLSSAESELAGIVKGSGEGIGLQSLCRDLGREEVALHVHADSSAALGICRRSGIGRVRHLAVAQLWVQEKLRRRELTLLKVAGEQNPADTLTKTLARALMDRHLASMSLLRSEGRAASAPLLSAEVNTSLAK